MPAFTARKCLNLSLDVWLVSYSLHPLLLSLFPFPDTQTTLAVPSPPDICSFSNNAQLQGCSAKCLLKGPKSETSNAVLLKRQTQVRIRKLGGGINKSSGQRGHQENISLPRSQAEKREALPEAGE